MNDGRACFLSQPADADQAVEEIAACD